MPQSTDQIFDRVPPQALDAERAVLGSMMVASTQPSAYSATGVSMNSESGLVVGKMAEMLTPDCFYRTVHQHIFAAAIRLYEKSKPVDLITLGEELKNMSVLEEVGGTYYLTELAESVPSAANVEFHARIVLEKYLLRRLITESANIARSCYDPVDDVHALLDMAEQRVYDVARIRKTQGFSEMSPVLSKVMEEIDTAQAGKITGIPTGFHKLDRDLCGLQRGDLIVVAGRPAMGKTAFALNVARYAASQVNYVAIFSLEMSKEQLAKRMLCSAARVDGHRMRLGELEDADFQKISAVAGPLSAMSIVIDESAALSVLEIRAKARRLKKVDLIVVDYLQLMSDPTQQDRNQEVTAITRGLKVMAKELNVPVIAVSQLSRAVEVRGGDKRPLLSDLRDSGSIEQDADVVMFLWRPEYYGINTWDGRPTQNVAEVIIAKQRNGPTGSVWLMFSPSWASFENLVIPTDMD